jgi:hypothetical protein
VRTGRTLTSNLSLSFERDLFEFGNEKNRNHKILCDDVNEIKKLKIKGVIKSK